MTAGLLKSCRTRDKMLKNLNKNKCKKNSPAAIRYRKFRNLLTTLTRKQKQKHYKHLFEKHKENMKKTIDLVNKLLNKCNDKSSITSTRFTINGQMVDDVTEIANGFNKFFTSIGPQTNQMVEGSETSSNEFLMRHSAPNGNSFAPSRITPEDLLKLCKNVQKKKY